MSQNNISKVLFSVGMVSLIYELLLFSENMLPSSRLLHIVLMVEFFFFFEKEDS